jgi:hypothetical protein
MAAPNDVRPVRWNNLVDLIADRTGRDPAVVDEWLNRVWSGRFLGDERGGEPRGSGPYERLKDRLQELNTTAGTLPVALTLWLAR